MKKFKFERQSRNSIKYMTSKIGKYASLLSLFDHMRKCRRSGMCIKIKEHKYTTKYATNIPIFRTWRIHHVLNIRNNTFFPAIEKTIKIYAYCKHRPISLYRIYGIHQPPISSYKRR